MYPYVKRLGSGEVKSRHILPFTLLYFLKLYFGVSITAFISDINAYCEKIYAMVVRERQTPSGDKPFDVELFRFLRGQIRKDKGGYYQHEYITRGIDSAVYGDGPGYNQLHRVDFRGELDFFLSTRDDVWLLDCGCGPGYFIKEMMDYAHGRGVSKRFHPRGVTLTSHIEADNPEDSDTTRHQMLFGKDIISFAHGEKIPFPDARFNMVVDTQGPWAYYGSPEMAPRRKALLGEYFRVLAPGGKLYLEDMYATGSLSVKSEKEEGNPLCEFLKSHPQAILMRAGADIVRISKGV
jgi:SAM-dependent methyltransferase